MAGEIRVLEDQLYEADYQNRVLRDNLERCRDTEQDASLEHLDLQPLESDARPNASDRLPQPSPDPRTDLPSEEDADVELPWLDEGDPVDPNELAPPTRENLSPGDRPDGLLPAPGGPQPPGKEDLEEPQVIPGEILPPLEDDDEIKPPGQIELPPSIRADGMPHELRLHTQLSGGRTLDSSTDEPSAGMLVVVQAVDELGKTVDLTQFDVDAELTVVVLDPESESAEARLGRWEFDDQQVAGFLRGEPVSGLHIPLRWEETAPSSDEVIVHVRLRAEEDEMRCEGRIQLKRSTAITDWTPRGEALR